MEKLTQKEFNNELNDAQKHGFQLCLYIDIQNAKKVTLGRWDVIVQGKTPYKKQIQDFLKSYKELNAKISIIIYRCINYKITYKYKHIFSDIVFRGNNISFRNNYIGE